MALSERLVQTVVSGKGAESSPALRPIRRWRVSAPYCSTASINSALQRARETLAKHYPGDRPQATPLSNPVQQRLLDRYPDAWQRHNVNGFVALLKEDATVIMPPWREWFVGRETIGSFFGVAWKTCNGRRLVPAGANGQSGSRRRFHAASLLKNVIRLWGNHGGAAFLRRSCGAGSSPAGSEL